MPNASGARGPARGPLVVSPANPRYFAVAGDPQGRAVYLTGSHVWNNFHDGLGPGRDAPAEPERNDFGAYLRFLAERGHNCIRLWRWEHFRSQAAGGAFHMHMTPQPWPRTGPGAAADGQPTFDLDAFDPAHFARLRERVAAAGALGIYVSVMLFDGFGLHLSPAPDQLFGHPFHAGNNVNGVGITSVRDYMTLPLAPRVRAIQEAYVRRVVDTLHDLPNVLYEVANEAPDWGDATAWQYWVVGLVKQYQRERGYAAHPVGMTMPYPVPDQTRVNAPLYAGPADWVSPGHDDPAFAEGAFAGRPPGARGAPDSRWYDDPPVNDGRKVVLSDTDHYAGGRVEAVWAWRTFLRGHQPLLMDYGIVDVVRPLDPSLGVPPFAAFEPARYAMGDTRRYAERVDLLAMTPRGDLASTGFALADPGREYLVLQPDAAGAPFTLDLPAGTYALEWFAVDARTAADGGAVAAARDGAVRLAPPPGGGPAVAYLRRVVGDGSH